MNIKRTSRFLFMGIVVLVLLGLGLAAADAATLTPDEQKLVNMINAERTSRGLAPLQVSDVLMDTAQMKAQDMATNNYFAHSSPTYGRVGDMVRAKGANMYVGENIQRRPDTSSTPVENAHRAFMKSTGHRTNMLRPYWQYVGVAIVKDVYGRILFVEHFAELKSQAGSGTSAPAGSGTGTTPAPVPNAPRTYTGSSSGTRSYWDGATSGSSPSAPTSTPKTGSSTPPSSWSGSTHSGGTTYTWLGSN